VADIHAAIVILVVSSLFLYRLGRLLTRRYSARFCRTLAVAVTLLLLLFAGMLHGRLFLARLLPWSNVIVLGNWIPLAAALLTGLAVGDEGAASRRRMAMLVALLGLAWYTVVAPLVEAVELWPGDVTYSAVQSSQVSCSAACAAKLLRLHGIDASERELAGLCLTNRFGTPPLGLYRGLRIKTRGTGWHVESTDFDNLRFCQGACGPMLIRVRLSGPKLVRTFNNQLAGWSPGMEHTLLLYGFADSGRPVMWDPAVPIDPNYLWTREELSQRRCGDVIRLVKNG
jgi:hypothetical protein